MSVSTTSLLSAVLPFRGGKEPSSSPSILTNKGVPSDCRSRVCAFFHLHEVNQSTSSLFLPQISPPHAWGFPIQSRGSQFSRLHRLQTQYKHSLLSHERNLNSFGSLYPKLVSVLSMVPCTRDFVLRRALSSFCSNDQMFYDMRFQSLNYRVTIYSQSLSGDSLSSLLLLSQPGSFSTLPTVLTLHHSRR